MKKQISTIVTYLLFFLIGIVTFGPFSANALDQGDVTVDMVTAPFFAQDHNQCDLVPEAAYVGFEVTNTSGSQLTGLEFTLTPTTTGYALASGQPGTLPIGTLADGDSFVVYFYIDFPCSTTATGDFDITVSDDGNGTHFEQISIDNVPVLEVGMSSIDSVLLEGGATTNEPLYLTVYYDFGTIKRNDQLSFQPAGNLDFDAGTFQLTRSEVIFSELLAVPENSIDMLYFISSDKQNGNGMQVAVTYTFEVKLPEVSTVFFPYATHWSGPQHNYSNDYGDVTSGTTFPGATPIPDIQIEKFTNGVLANTEPGPIVVPGSTITWTYVVTNPGQAPLNGVDITDDNGTPDTGDDFSPAFDNGDLDGDGYLDLGETWTFTYTGIAIGGQYGNVGYTSATDDLGNVVADSNESHYFGSMPAITLEVHTNGEDADDPTGPTLIVGSEVIWTYYVTNIGNINLTDVSVIDNAGTPGIPGDNFSPTYISGDDGNGILDIGEQWIFEDTSAAQLGQYGNQATATASEPSLQTFSDRDNSHYIGVLPAINVEKTTNGQDADNAPGPYVRIGDRVTWLYTITNLAGEPLTNITITDDHGTIDPGDDFVPTYVSGDVNSDNILDVEEAWVYRKRGFSINDGQYGNKATVTGTMASGQVLVASDFSHFFGTSASLFIENLTNGSDADAPTGPNLVPGDPVTWNYSVTNNGNVDLTSVTVVDDNGTPRNLSDDFNPNYIQGDVNGDNILQIGETWEYEATGTVKAGQYGNYAKVSAWSPAENFVYDTDKSHYFGVVTVLSLDVLTNGEESDSPSGPQIEEGEDVVWTYIVSLEGNSHVERLTLIDDNGTPRDPSDDFTPAYIGGDENKNGYVDAGEQWIYQAESSALLGQHSNLSYASAMNLAGKRAQDNDESYYYGIPLNALMEYGDAPEGSIAYPGLGTIGVFPTRTEPTFASHIGHRTLDMFFGPMFDFETPDNNGAMLSGPSDRYEDECFDDGDAGMVMPTGYTIGDDGEIASCGQRGNTSLGSAMEMVSWGTAIDIEVKNYSTREAYVNVLADWNQDGQWAYSPTTLVNGEPVAEHVLFNFPVPAGFSGRLSDLLPPDIQIGPQSGYIWIRFSITPEPVSDNWAGDGLFEDGETEDYLIHVSPQAAVPLSGWTLILVMVAMFLTTFLIYRKK